MTHCAWPKCGTFPLWRILQWSRRKRGCWCKYLSPWIHTVKWCEVCSCGVSPSLFTQLQCASCSVGSIAFCKRGALPEQCHIHMRQRIHHWRIRDSDKRVHAHLPVRLPSIGAEMLAIAACTHVHPHVTCVDDQFATVAIVILDSRRRWSTERRCVEMLTNVVVLVAEVTQLPWPEAALPCMRRDMVVPCLRRRASRCRCLATAGLIEGTELHGTPARRGIPRRPSNQTFVAVPKLKKKHISSTTISTDKSMETLGGRRCSAKGRRRDVTRSCLGRPPPHRQH